MPQIITLFKAIAVIDNIKEFLIDDKTTTQDKQDPNPNDIQRRVAQTLLFFKKYICEVGQGRLSHFRVQIS